MKTKKKISKGEIVTWVIAGIFIAAGLSLIVLGIVGSHLGVKAEDNSIVMTEATLRNGTGMGYRWWGVIFMLIGVVGAVISLNLFARKEDRDEERSARRRERLTLKGNEENPTSEAIEVEAQPKDGNPA